MVVKFKVMSRILCGKRESEYQKKCIHMHTIFQILSLEFSSKIIIYDYDVI